MLAMSCDEILIQSLCQQISSVVFAVNLLQFENFGLNCIVNKMLAKVNVLCPLTSSDRALRPCDTTLVVFKDNGRLCLRKPHVGQEFAKVNHLLNERTGSNKLDLCSRQRNRRLTLRSPRNSCAIEHKHIPGGRSARVGTTSPV